MMLRVKQQLPLQKRKKKKRKMQHQKRLAGLHQDHVFSKQRLMWHSGSSCSQFGMPSCGYHAEFILPSRRYLDNNDIRKKRARNFPGSLFLSVNVIAIW